VGITASIPADEGALPAQLADLRRTVRELGPSVAASLLPVVSELERTINERLAKDYYTRTQTDAAAASAASAAVAPLPKFSDLASPGAIAPTTVTASGDVKAPSARVTNLFASAAPTNNITGTRVTAWLQTADGMLGMATSSRRYKQDIEPADLDVDAVLAIELVRYRYIAEVRKRDDPDYEHYVGPDYVPAMELGVIAEQLDDLGLKDFVVYAPDGEGGERPDGVHYELLALALLPTIQEQARRLTDLEERLNALEQRAA
jgi:hypothetical protein